MDTTHLIIATRLWPRLPPGYLLRLQQLPTHLLDGISAAILDDEDNIIIGDADWIDTKGLLVNDKSLVQSELWELFFDENDDAYDDDTRIINVEAYAGLNDTELIGTSTKGYVLYAEETARTILNRALRFYGLPPA